MYTRVTRSGKGVTLLGSEIYGSGACHLRIVLTREQVPGKNNGRSAQEKTGLFQQSGLAYNLCRRPHTSHQEDLYERLSVVAGLQIPARAQYRRNGFSARTAKLEEADPVGQDSAFGSCRLRLRTLLSGIKQEHPRTQPKCTVPGV